MILSSWTHKEAIIVSEMRFVDLSFIIIVLYINIAGVLSQQPGSGPITTIAGTGTGSYSGDNGQATSAELNYPFGVVADSSSGNYIL